MNVLFRFTPMRRSRLSAPGLQNFIKNLQHGRNSMAMPLPFRQTLEKRLYALGFASGIIRHLLATQIVIAGAGLILGLALSWLTLGPLLFGIGATIAVFSLWQLARFAQAHIQHRFSAGLALKLFAGFTARLVLISIVLFALIVWLRAPVIPLLIGLTSTVAGIALWGLSRFAGKTAKEA